MGAGESGSLVVIQEHDYDRRKFLGSSNVAAALGLSQYQSPYGVYLAKTADVREELDPERKKFLERRKRWEPVVVQMLREEFDAEIVAVNQRYVDPVCPYFAAEIDFEWRDTTDGSIQNGEIKTVHPRVYGERFGWGEPGTGDIPIEYEAQVVHGLGVTGRRTTFVAVMVGLDDMVFYRVDRDQALLDEMRAGLQAFWINHVVALEPPPPANLRDLHTMFRKPKAGLRVDADSALGAKALQLRAVRAAIDAHELQAEALEFEVKNAMREAEELWVNEPGGTARKLVTWGEQNWTRLDQAALKETAPAVHKAFTKTGKHRVFKTLKST